MLFFLTSWLSKWNFKSCIYRFSPSSHTVQIERNRKASRIDAYVYLELMLVKHRTGGKKEEIWNILYSTKYLSKLDLCWAFIFLSIHDIVVSSPPLLEIIISAGTQDIHRFEFSGYFESLQRTEAVKSFIASLFLLYSKFGWAKI